MLIGGCRSFHTMVQKPEMGASEVEYEKELIQIPSVNPYFTLLNPSFTQTGNQLSSHQVF